MPRKRTSKIELGDPDAKRVSGLVRNNPSIFDTDAHSNELANNFSGQVCESTILSDPEGMAKALEKSAGSDLSGYVEYKGADCE